MNRTDFSRWHGTIRAGGGNGDGQIDSRDQIFPYLRCGSTETTTGSPAQRALHLAGIRGGVHLAGLQGQKDDGSVRQPIPPIAPTWMTQSHSKVGRFAYDVFLVVK